MITTNNPLRIGALTALFAILPAAAVLLPCFMAEAGTQDTPTLPVPVTRSAKVSLAGLDLSTPTGAQEARNRLRAAARRLCSQVADSEDLSHQPNYVRCVDASITAALNQLPPPALAALNRNP